MTKPALVDEFQLWFKRQDPLGALALEISGELEGAGVPPHRIGQLMAACFAAGIHYKAVEQQRLETLAEIHIPGTPN